MSVTLSLLRASFAVTLSAVAVSSAFAAVNDYKEVACDADFFKTNGCNQCFDGGTVSSGQKLTGFYDMWVNKNKTEQIMYKGEQSLPEMVSLTTGSKWISNPVDPSAFWKFGQQIVWVDSLTGSGKQEYTLDGEKSVRVYEADLGAAYALEKTDAKPGAPVGLLRFPLNYHDVDQDGNEKPKALHVECVAYALSGTVAEPPKPVVKPPVVTPKPTVKPQPKPELTKVKTGPEEFVLVFLTMLIVVGIMFMRRRVH